MNKNKHSLKPIYTLVLSSNLEKINNTIILNKDVDNFKFIQRESKDNTIQVNQFIKGILLSDDLNLNTLLASILKNFNDYTSVFENNSDIADIYLFDTEQDAIDMSKSINSKVNMYKESLLFDIQKKQKTVYQTCVCDLSIIITDFFNIFFADGIDQILDLYPTVYDLAEGLLFPENYIERNDLKGYDVFPKLDLTDVISNDKKSESV